MLSGFACNKMEPGRRSEALITALDISKVRPIVFCAVCQSLVRDPARRADAPDRVAECDKGGPLPIAASIGWH